MTAQVWIMKESQCPNGKDLENPFASRFCADLFAEYIKKILQAPRDPVNLEDSSDSRNEFWKNPNWILFLIVLKNWQI